VTSNRCSHSNSVADCCSISTYRSFLTPKQLGSSKKEADLYSAFIEVPYLKTLRYGSQCYLQITPYLPLPRKHSPDGASQTEVAEI